MSAVEDILLAKVFEALNAKIYFAYNQKHPELIQRRYDH